MSNITGNCDLKCAFSCHYLPSSCIAYNRGNYISFTYDKTSTSPVTYNAMHYDVTELRVYTPSLHTFNGSQQDAELIVVHSSNTNADKLLVCVPVSVKGQSNDTFKQLIDTVAANAPAEDEHTTITSCDLSNLVPRQPFFSYSATEPYQPCSEDQSYDFIVFTDTIGILSDTLNKLQNIIATHPYTIKQNANTRLFYNPKGVSDTGAGGNDNIYIDCQPVNAENNDADNINVVLDKPNTSTFDWANNTYIRLLMGSIGFIVLLFVINYLLKLTTPSAS